MKKLLALCTLFVGSAVLVGCGTTSPTPAVDQDAPQVQVQETISVGVIAPLSGPAATYGEDALHGIRYMQEKINTAGGVDGKQIELIVEDGKCGGKDAVSAVNKLINVDQVAAILGGLCSSETIAAGKIAQANGVPMISSLSSSPEISSIGEYVFRYWNDADAGNEMINYIESDGSKNIALIYETTDYASAYAAVVKESLAGEVVFEEKFNSDEKDFGILAKNVADVKDEIDYLVYIPQSESNVIPFVKELESEGVWDELKEKFIGTETMMTETMVTELGALAEGMQGLALGKADALGSDVSATLEELIDGYEVKSADVFILLAADSLQLLSEAVEAEGYTSAGVQSHLASITEDNVRESLFGSMWFDAEGDGQGLPFSVLKVEGGEIVTQ